MPIQQPNLAIAVREASVRCTQAGGGNILTLGIQSAGDGDELQRPRAYSKQSVAYRKVRAGIELFLCEDYIAALIRKLIVCQCFHRLRLSDGIVHNTEFILSEVALYFDVAVILSRQRRTVVFLRQRLNRQGRLRDCGLRFGDGQSTKGLYREVFAGIQVCLRKHSLALSILEFIAVNGRRASDFFDLVIRNLDLVFADRAAEQIALIALHGQRSSVIFLAGIEAPQGERGDRRLLRFRRGGRLRARLRRGGRFRARFR